VGEAGVYGTLLMSQLRSQASYRLSFGMDVVGSAAVALADLVEIYVVFANIPVFGGLDYPAVLLVFAIAQLAFGLANVITGNLDEVPRLVRSGTLDVLLLRPLPVLGQLLVAEVMLKRVGRVAVAGALLAFALTRLTVEWSPARIWLLVSAPLCGAAIFAAAFVLAGAAQFWLLDGAELTNSLTYGSSYAATIPASVMSLPLRVLFGFVLPAAFVGYLPTIELLGQPGPPWLPAGLAWWAPVAAAVSWTLALLCWRQGLRHYSGGGG
jgi:viologen exporter family transport system permease protein